MTYLTNKPSCWEIHTHIYLYLPNKSDVFWSVYCLLTRGAWNGALRIFSYTLLCLSIDFYLHSLFFEFNSSCNSNNRVTVLTLDTIFYCHFNAVEKTFLFILFWDIINFSKTSNVFKSHVTSLMLQKQKKLLTLLIHIFKIKSVTSFCSGLPILNYNLHLHVLVGLNIVKKMFFPKHAIPKVSRSDIHRQAHECAPTKRLDH